MQGLEPQLQQLTERHAAQLQAAREDAQSAASAAAAEAREQAARQMQAAREEWEAQRRADDQKWRDEWQKKLLDASERSVDTFHVYPLSHLKNCPSRRVWEVRITRVMLNPFPT